MSEPPPSLTQIFTKIPPTMENLPTPVEYSIAQRRSVLGALIFSTVSTNRTSLGSNSFQYICGQLISFTDSIPQPSVLPLASTYSDIQHGLNTLDYDQLGLTKEQQQAIDDASQAAFAELQSQVAQTRSDYLALQTALNEDQKVINDTTTAISALQILTANPAIANMVGTLQSAQNAAQARILANTTNANALSITLNNLVDQMNSLSQVVR